MRIMSVLWLTSAFALPLLAGCGRSDKRTTSDTAGGTVAMTDSAGIGGLGDNVPGAIDASVASFVNTISTVEVESGRLATTKARNSAVKDYAEDMVDEHQKTIEELRTLGARSGWSFPDAKPGTSPGGTMNSGIEAAMSALRQSHDSTMQRLRTASGAQFDRTYISTQIAGHQRALDVLRQHAPSVRNTELRDKVLDIEKDIEERLREAQEIASKLTGAKGS